MQFFRRRRCMSELHKIFPSNEHVTNRRKFVSNPFRRGTDSPSEESSSLSNSELRREIPRRARDLRCPADFPLPSVQRAAAHGEPSRSHPARVPLAAPGPRQRRRGCRDTLPPMSCRPTLYAVHFASHAGSPTDQTTHPFPVSAVQTLRF